MRSSRLPLQISERKTLLILMDGVLVNVAILAALWLGARRSGWPFTLEFLLSRFYWFPGLTALYFILAPVNDCYNLKVASDALSSAFALFKTTALMLVVYFSLYFLAEPRTLPTYWPRHIVGFYGLVSVPLLSFWRWLYIAVFTAPQFRRRALIVGAGWAGRTIAQAIHDNLSADYEIVGFIDDDPGKQGQTIEGIPVLGDHSRLGPLAEEMGISEIVLAITRDLRGDMFQAIMDCNERGIQITPMPILYEQMTGRMAVEHVGDNWLVVLPINGISTFSPFMLLKRLADVLVSVLGLAFLLAVLPFVALAIYLESPGPIFYSQERVGRAGRTFRLVKLRSMVPDAEQDGRPKWAEEDDERVTRVGRFLRRTRLDELPQFINVLRGEMSLIGPRPERPEFVAELQKRIPFYRSRLAVRPGLTGWAQVNYHYGSSVEDALVKLQYDLYYIKYQSLYLDLRILLKTIGVVLSFQGT
ncbi:MAG TPA: sugar transferase [Anaerolineae bacterium]|nr:sugar transferase [Anaerolineae bacterium]